MAAYLVLFVLGLWAGAGLALALISLVAAGSKAAPLSRLYGISVDRSSDAI
jgi:hypothetical protein